MSEHKWIFEPLEELARFACKNGKADLAESLEVVIAEYLKEVKTDEDAHLAATRLNELLQDILSAAGRVN